MRVKERNRYWRVIVLAAALLGAACGDDKNDACAPSSHFYCLDNLGNGVCADVAREPMCIGSQWVCPAGTAPEDDCDCKGAAPGSGCTCTTTGWNCP
jgi:hypothetical protein